MGGKGKVPDDMKDWPKANEVALVQLLVGKVREGKLQSSTFKKEVWSEINSEICDAIGVDYGIDKLKGKFNRLRTKYRHFSELIGHTGVKWDMTSNIVHASQDIWEEFFKFKKQGCEDYELLGEIFNTTTATGKLQQLSTEDPLSPNEEKRLEEEFLYGSIHVDLEGNNSESEKPEKGKKHKIDSIFGDCRSNKMNKMNKMKVFLDKWASTLSAKEEAAKAKAERYKLSIPDLYSIGICMELLEKIEYVSSRSYNKAIEKFTSAEWR
ncbi:hypothetical protein HRI_003078600 [Hibiscus trionum]|uniref:Myb/SANT-like domain-containing protein n=1 Tax=Hibiscus trionum TaxID=183268 RepID=A0A9W7IET8_HIBTR|nr:hypothetical protein HRI_003078600 [Hibiscus trionum]